MRFAALSTGLMTVALMASHPAGAQDAESGEATDVEATDATEGAAEGEAAEGEAAEKDPYLDVEPVELGDLKDYYGTVSVSMPDDAPALVADGTVFEDGEVTARFESGYFFPIFSGKTAEEWAEIDAEAEKAKAKAKDSDEEEAEEEKEKDRAERIAVGYVFVGKGTLEVRFHNPHYARAYANHMVVDRNQSVEDYRAIAKEGAPLVKGFTEGMVFSADGTIQPFLEALPQASLPGDAKSDLGQTEPVVVPEESSFANARKAALKYYSKRGEVLGRWQTSPSQVVKSDRLKLDKLHYPMEQLRMMGDFFIDERHGLIIDRKGGNPVEDRFLTYARDPSGRWDTKLHSEVIASGEVGPDRFAGSTLTISPFPSIDPEVPDWTPAAPWRFEAVSLDVTTDTALTADKFFIEATAESLMTVEAVGGPQQVVYFSVSKREAVRKSWELLELSLEDGTPCTWFEPDSKDFRKLSGYVSCILPRPLEVGQRVTLRIKSKDTFPYANLVAHTAGGTSESAALQGSLGLSTGLMMVYPNLQGAYAMGGAWNLTHRVGVPLDAKLTAALSGVTTSEWEQDGKYWVEAKTAGTALYPGYAVGSWTTVKAPATEGMPSIKIHMFGKSTAGLKEFPPEMRRIVTTYERYLPKFPWEELELFQAPDMFYGYVWIAPHGMVNLQNTRVLSSDTVGGGEAAFRDGTPHMESGVLAHELAHQYWGHTVRPSHIHEGWVNETMSETFSCIYVGDAFGSGDFFARMEKYREAWEESLPEGAWAPLPRAYESPYQPLIVYNYGPYVMHMMLRRRMGDGAFFTAIDQFARDFYKKTVTTEQFLAALNNQTEEDFTDFFDYWIYGGFVPDEVTLTWKLDGDKVVGTIESNVPFGTFDVPVRISDASGNTGDLMVLVTDGEGTFTSDSLASTDKLIVELDPDGYILARKRKVKKG